MMNVEMSSFTCGNIFDVKVKKKKKKSTRSGFENSILRFCVPSADVFPAARTAGGDRSSACSAGF